MPVKKQNIKLKYDPQAQTWEMDDGKSGFKGSSDYPKLEVEHGHVGVFTFKIQDSGGSIVFDQKDPFTAKAGSPADFNEQFTVLGNGTRTLTVIDANASANGGEYQGGTYTYALNFNSVESLDPIITNMGCCKSLAMSGAEAVGYSLFLAGAGALAAVGYRKWRAKRSPTAAGAAGVNTPKGP